MLSPCAKPTSDTRLVATNLPDGFVLVEEAGVSENPHSLFRHTLSRNGSVIKKGLSVGLSCLVCGKNIPAPTYYYCVIAPVSGIKSVDRPTPTAMFENAWETQHELIEGVLTFLASGPTDDEVLRMTGFVQGVCACRSWTVPVEVYSMTVAYHQKNRLGGTSKP